MIISGVLDILYSIFSVLTLPIDLPEMPNQIRTYINQLVSYMNTGYKILNVYLPMDYIMLLFGIIIAVDIGINLYKFVMWVIKKIPMLNIS